MYGIETVGVGQNGSAQPASSIYQITADGKGNVTGWATKSIDGTLVTFTFKGTYTVAANCTGTTTFTNQDNQVEHDTFVLNNANKSAFLIQTDSGHVQSSIAVAQATTTCTDATVAHTYAAQMAGLVNDKQFAFMGQLTLNEKTVGTTETGTLTGTATVSLNGVITPRHR